MFAGVVHACKWVAPIVGVDEVIGKCGTKIEVDLNAEEGDSTKSCGGVSFAEKNGMMKEIERVSFAEKNGMMKEIELHEEVRGIS